MAKCKICNAEIPEGAKYCKDCRDKKLESANESYLDDLLSSVKDTSPSNEELYRKKDRAGKKAAPVAADLNPIAEDSMDEEKIAEFPEENLSNAGLDALLQGTPAASAKDDNDFLDLIGQMSSEDPVAEDIMAINDLLKGVAATNTKDTRAKDLPGDVGEVFSDALTAVSTLKDQEQNVSKAYVDDDFSKIINKKKIQKQKKQRKEKKQKKEKKPPLFRRIFSNVKDDKTAVKHEEELRAAKEAKAAKAALKEPKGSRKKPKELQAVTAAQGMPDAGKDGEDTPKKLTGKEIREARRKERAEKRLAKKAIQVIDEAPEDPGRINRAGATVVFAFFGIVAAVLILGTDVASYNLSIKHAKAYFGNQKYNEAYEEVSGEEIKDQDIDLYNKIMTVMYVNKQLNSYRSYYAMKDYPKALDSLLKGLDRYDKYIEFATILGIEEDMDYVRTQLLAELNQVFHLPEEEAVKILASEDTKAYSIAVYNVVLENMAE